MDLRRWILMADKYFDTDFQSAQKPQAVNEFIYAEVIEIVLEPEKDLKETVGRIKFRPLNEGGKSEDSLSWAYPISTNFRTLPVLHEIVPIVHLLKRYYYFPPINTNNMISNNIAPKISEAFADTSSASSGEYSKNSDSGIANKKNDSNSEVTMGSYIENKNKLISTLKHYEGDIIVQGRFGNNIRFGSNVIDKTNLPQLKISLIDDEEVSLKDESLDKDNSIWLTTDGKISFTIKSIPIHTDNNATTEFADKQMFLFSDRIVVQSKENEMMFFSNKGIHFACNLNYSVDTDKKIVTHAKDNTEINTEKKLVTYSEMETEIKSLKTYIGKVDKENLVLGEQWRLMMMKLVKFIDSHKHPTGTGPSGPPLPPEGMFGEFEKIRASIEAKDHLSDDNFTTKKNR